MMAIKVGKWAARLKYREERESEGEKGGTEIEN